MPSQPTRSPAGRLRAYPALLLGGGVLLSVLALVSCGPTPPTAPSSSVPTWTPLPLPHATVAPLPLSPWPTALPTPTPAAALRPGMQVGTFFFYWHDCPDNGCPANRVYALPPGWSAPLAGDPDALDGLYYSSLNRYWYALELRDMRLAGIDIVLPVCWGEYPGAWFRTGVLANLVEANRRLDPPLRIGLFDDTSSEVDEYRDYADNREFDGSAYFNGTIPLDLSDPAAGFFFYDRKIKPFFRLIPQEMWATHNGKPLEEGGRPLIVTYTRDNVAHMEYAGALWTAVKEAFQRDFRDRNGRPIEPFVILEESWFSADALAGEPSLAEVADGRYTWGTTVLGPRWHTVGDYTVASAGPGFDERNYLGGQGRVQRRDLTLAGQPGDPGSYLRDSLAQVPVETDLLLIETWNELWEGTGVCRADYPAIAGRPVPEDYYLDLLRRELRGQGLWWAAQPLAPSWPEHWSAGQTYRLLLPLQNSGARTWCSTAGAALHLAGDLFPDTPALPPAEPVRPGEVGHFAITLTAPLDPGTYGLSWQMVGPEGAFGPPATWTIRVERALVAPALQLEIEPEELRAGRPFTLTARLQPATEAAALRLQVRFDPAAFRVEALLPPADRPLRRWQVAVDNERGTAALEMELEPAGALPGLAQLRLRPRAAGPTGLWITGLTLTLTDGATLVLPEQWVPLTVEPSP